MIRLFRFWQISGLNGAIVEKVLGMLCARYLFSRSIKNSHQKLLIGHFGKPDYGLAVLGYEP